jgi:hypothetical protein
MLVELFVLEKGLGVRDRVGALVTLVWRVQVKRQVLHILSILLLLYGCVEFGQVFGHV